MPILFAFAIAGFFIAGNITNWDDTLMLCIVGLAMGAWGLYTGHNIVGWFLVVLCGGAAVLYLVAG